MALEKCETDLRLDEQRHRYQRAELLEELEATSRAGLTGLRTKRSDCSGSRYERGYAAGATGVADS